MAKYLLLAAAAVAFSAPAVAGITVLGSNSARMCYLAAESIGMPSYDDVQRCNVGLAESANDSTNLVATYVNRGIIRLRRNDVDGALRDFDSAVRINPNEPEAYLNRGSALLRREAAAEARDMFSYAIDRNTRRPALAHYGRAVANETLGNVRAAYEDYQRASQLDPDWQAPRDDLQRFRVVPAAQSADG